jgi:hypothetical protein
MPRVLACALVASALAAGAAHADAIRFSSPSAGDTLRGGQSVVVRWENLPPLDEFELLLRIGADPRATVRLTRSLDDGEASYRWRVPNLPARSARLVLRGELHETEVELAASETFQIGVDPFTPLEEISFRDGELWDAPQSSSLPGDAFSGASSERVSQSRADDSPAEAPRSRSAVSSDPLCENPAAALGDVPARPASSPSLLALPRFVPKRN